MLVAPLPKNELERIKALKALAILDTPGEAEFDALVKAASVICDVPISLISLIDSQRQWFKANQGLPGQSETHRDDAFCSHTILEEGVFEVEDASKDERFHDNPLVATHPNIRFYAGVTLALSNGANIGTLCVIDTKPQKLSIRQKEALKSLALSAVAALEKRKEYIEKNLQLLNLTDELTASEELHKKTYESTPAMMHTISPEGKIISVSQLWLTTLGYELDEVIGQPSIKFLTSKSRLFAQKNAIPKLMKDRVINDVPLQMVKKNGELIDVLLSSILESDKLGNPISAMAVVRDVTEERSSFLTKEALLKTIKNEFITSTADRTGDIIEVNDAFCAISQYSTPELLGHNHRFINSGYHPTSFFKDMWETISIGETWHGEVCNRAKDGSLYWVDSVITPFKNSSDEIYCFVSISKDITARKNQDAIIKKTQSLLEHTGKMAQVGGWEVDLINDSIYWTDQTCHIHGVAPGHVPKIEDAINFYAPEARPVIQDAIDLAIANKTSWDLELPFIKADGTPIWVRAQGNPKYNANDEVVGLIGAFQDITLHRELANDLSTQHELLRVTLKSIGDAVITTDAKGKVVWLNPIAERLTGWSSAEAKGRPLPQVFNIVNEDTRLKTENPIATALSQGKIVGLANHTVLISRDGDEYGIEDSAAPIKNENGDLLGGVLVFHDVSEQRRLSGEVNYRAKHDSLTGLVNRGEFEKCLRRILHETHEKKSSHALMYIDLDQFKIVNDTCGHSVGDKLLINIGKQIGSSLRSSDILARLGGDEFGILLHDCSIEKATKIADDICNTMEHYRFAHEEHRFRVGTSIGLVQVDNRWQTNSTLMQAADAACYAAKEAGKNRVHVWFDSDKALRERQGEMQWANRLELAIDQDYFALYAQRIEKISEPETGIHAEILLRMLDPDGNLTMPSSFIPAAERYQLATRLDKWVLRNTIEYLKTHHNIAMVKMICVNLSGQSIGDRAFHRDATALLKSAGESICKLLCLEITETAAVTNITDAALFIEQVHELGVKIALDDFGAGASSFGYLKNLGVDILKIDGQFIQNLLEEPLCDSAVRSFIDVAKVVGLETVAEYVDNPEVLARIKELGVNYAQGFLLHKPQSIDIVLGPLKSH